MREKPIKAVPCNIVIRITPAYAGKTLRLIVAFRQVQDHPRVCGKNLSAETQLLHCLGSPPRMREKLVDGCNSTTR